MKKKVYITNENGKVVELSIWGMGTEAECVSVGVSGGRAGSGFITSYNGPFDVPCILRDIRTKYFMATVYDEAGYLFYCGNMSSEEELRKSMLDYVNFTRIAEFLSNNDLNNIDINTVCVE